MWMHLLPLKSQCIYKEGGGGASYLYIYLHLHVLELEKIICCLLLWREICLCWQRLPAILKAGRVDTTQLLLSTVPSVPPESNLPRSRSLLMFLRSRKLLPQTCTPQWWLEEGSLFRDVCQSPRTNYKLDSAAYPLPSFLSLNTLGLKVFYLLVLFLATAGGRVYTL